MARGFGVAGALDRKIVTQLAAEAEKAGYSTFWANDTPNGNGLEALSAAASTTNSIRLGVGVIPIDRKPADVIAAEVETPGLPQERLTVGIGAGGLTTGSVDAVGEAAKLIKDSLGARVLVGALGPNMTKLGGSAADGALLNWLTPDAAADSFELVQEAAASTGLPAPHVSAYVRVALGDKAYARLAEESARYESYPQYKRHFDRMGVVALETSIFAEEPETLQTRLAAFEDVVDEVVVRAICGDETIEDYLLLLHATAPR